MSRSIRYQPRGCGSRTVRLADIPIEQRLRAVRQLACLEQIKTETERATLLALAIEPGDKGGRVAA